MQKVPVTVVAISMVDDTKLITGLPFNEFDWEAGTVLSVIPDSLVAMGPASFPLMIANGHWDTFEGFPDDPRTAATISLDDESIELLHETQSA